MQYLYGDSTPSPVAANFIEFLRDALDYAVHALQAEERLEAARERRRARATAGEAEVRQLEALGRNVGRAVEQSGAGPADSATSRCAAAIARSVQDAVTNEISAVRAALAADLARIDGEAAQERHGCLRALEALLAKHDFPEMRRRLHLTLEGGAYAAELQVGTPWGLEGTIELDVPSGSLFAHEVRVDRLIEHIEVHAPETSGWLRKEVRMVPHKLGRHHVAELVLDTDETLIKLRTSHDTSGSGFDVEIDPNTRRVVLIRVGKEGEGASSFDVESGDVATLLKLRDELITATAPVTASRRSLIGASLDGLDLGEDARPIAMVERMVDSMAPIVQEISEHSLEPSELVLRRKLADDRREEIFVTKQELLQKLAPLSEEMRLLFEPLGILDAGEIPAPRPRPRASTPPAQLGDGARSTLAFGEPAAAARSPRSTQPLDASRPLPARAARPSQPPLDPSAAAAIARATQLGPAPDAAATPATTPATAPGSTPDGAPRAARTTQPPPEGPGVLAPSRPARVTQPPATDAAAAATPRPETIEVAVDDAWEDGEPGSGRAPSAGSVELERALFDLDQAGQERDGGGDKR
jgi:hypothetical protein